MKVSLSVGLLATSGIVDASKAVRAPSQRAQKNQQFLEQWFSNNCKTNTEVDAVRPTRCDNKINRYMVEWEKLQASFDHCGFFDGDVKNGGPRPALQRRRRDDDYETDGDDEDYYGEEDNLFDNEIFNFTDEDLTEIQQYQNYGDNTPVEDDYWAYMANYMDDYLEVETDSDSTTDEDNGAIRTIMDLKKLEERAFSKDPARAHRQIVNAMKQYVKRFLDECVNSPNKLKRLTKVYRETAKLHELILSTVADKYRRLDARASRRV